MLRSEGSAILHLLQGQAGTLMSCDMPASSVVYLSRTPSTGLQEPPTDMDGEAGTGTVGIESRSCFKSCPVDPASNFGCEGDLCLVLYKDCGGGNHPLSTDMSFSMIYI